MVAAPWDGIYAWLAAAALASARVGPIFLTLPFLGASVLPSGARIAVATLVGMALLPAPDTSLLKAGVDLPGLLHEAGIGLLLSCLLAWPFWVVQAWGAIADNMRGATLAAILDPSSGAESSELANLLQLLAAAVFLQAGGVPLMLELIQHSYQLCPPLQPCTLALPPLLALLGRTLASALLLASPLIGGALAADVALGMLSRLTPQLNAFALSLTLKSMLVIALLLLYVGSELPTALSTATLPLEAALRPPAA